MEGTYNNLPAELHVMIFSKNLSPHDLHNVSQMNLHLQKVLHDNRSTIWRAFLVRDFNAQKDFVDPLSAGERKIAYFRMKYLEDAFVTRGRREPARAERVTTLKHLYDIHFFPRLLQFLDTQPGASLQNALNHFDTLTYQFKRRMLSMSKSWLFDGIASSQTFLEAILDQDSFLRIHLIQEVPFVKLIQLRKRGDLELPPIILDEFQRQLMSFRNAEDIADDNLAIIDFWRDEREFAYPPNYATALVDALLKNARKRHFDEL